MEKYMFRKFRNILIISAFFAVILPVFVSADTFGQEATFFVHEDYDLNERNEINSTLRYVGQKSYIYLENEWWNNLDVGEKNEVMSAISNLSEEFDNHIYPELTSAYGTEWSPGIDKDERITILFHQMKEGVGGYNRVSDEHYRTQAPSSNQREMIYLSTDYILSPLLHGYVGHEFTHLITWFQKTLIYNTRQEEIWLDEARADYTSSFLGYDDEFEGSNLQNRAREFMRNPSDSITEWENKKKDYAAVHLFTQYVVDHHGENILIDSLKNENVGIESINYALRTNGFDKTFSDVFSDWVIALYLNDCSYGQYYCYKNENLRNIRVIPSLIFLPSTQETNISLTYSVKDWSARWFKIIGGDKGLEIEIENKSDGKLVIPYIITKNGNELTIDKLEFPGSSGKINLPEFAQENISLILIPTGQEKLFSFEGDEPSHSFVVNISTIESENTENSAKPISEMTIAELKAKIAEIQQMILQLQKLLLELMGSQEANCTQIAKNLYYGMMNDSEVRCLQEFLKSQDNVYPEGIVNGNFLNLTQQAVISFQEKYADEILKPLGLSSGTGYVGSSTRQKINELMNI